MIECCDCGEKFTNKGIGHHWRQTGCSYPEPTENRKRLSFSNSETRELLNWFGERPEGFEYKWELQDYEEYIRLKEKTYKS